MESNTKSKISIKTITLYDLCANNDVLLISIIHHIIILLFNYYSVIHLDFLKQKFIKFTTNFELIQYNIEICQAISFFTIFFIFYVSKPMSQKNEHKNNSIVGIMTISFVTKMSIALYQYYHNNGIYIKYNTEEKETFGPFYDFILLSYFLRFGICMFMLTVIIIIPTIICCDQFTKKMIKWSKNYRLTITEEKPNDGSEDV